LFGRASDSIGKCESSGALPYISSLCIVNLGCLVAGVFQAYKARHLSTDFAESEYIAMSMALLLVVGFIAIPVAIIAEENPGAFFFVVTAVIFVCSMSLLLLIFVPKVMSLRLGGQGVSRQSSTRRSSVFQSSKDKAGSFTEGITCVDKKEWLPKLETDNRDLERLTQAMEARIVHIEQETGESEEPTGGLEHARVMIDSSRQSGSHNEGMRVRDMSMELNDAQSENKRLRKLRRELEDRLTKLENKQLREDKV
jgi:7 transmembrane sweet-taste receptor of 3 GCPR